MPFKHTKHLCLLAFEFTLGETKLFRTTGLSQYGLETLVDSGLINQCGHHEGALGAQEINFECKSPDNRRVRLLGQLVNALHKHEADQAFDISSAVIGNSLLFLTRHFVIDAYHGS